MKNNTPKVKKIPERQCLGCNAHRPKKELIRVVRCPDGQIVLDTVGKTSGRGAYICKNPECFKKARKAGRFSRNLNCEIPEEIYGKLEKEMEAYGKQ